MEDHQIKAGDNIQLEIVDGIATFTIDLSERLGPSSTGKTTIVASTGGAKKIPGQPNLNLRMNISLYEMRHSAK